MLTIGAKAFPEKTPGLYYFKNSTSVIGFSFVCSRFNLHLDRKRIRGFWLRRVLRGKQDYGSG